MQADPVERPRILVLASGSGSNLQALIDADTRLVVLADPDEGAPAWYHDESALVYATTWYYTDPGELDCVTTTDPFPHGLYEVTHVLTAPIALPELAERYAAEPPKGEIVLLVTEIS